MAIVKPRGGQLDIVDVAQEIENTTLAIQAIATGVTSDPTAQATMDGEYLRLDRANGNWLEDITSESIKDLSDVFTTMTPTDGQVLTYDTTNGWQAETPVDHSSVILTAGEGLTGGGDITANRTFDLDIPGLTEELLPTTDDFVVLYENTGAVHKKVALSNLPTGSTAHAGQADVVHQDARNSSGGTITAGTPVYVDGFHVGSGLPTIAEADASTPSTMPALGVMLADVINNADGIIVLIGSISGLNTSSWGGGDSLWIATGGGLSNTRPIGATTPIQKIGFVTRSHISSGSIAVNGPGRSNDVPNMASGSYWKGDGSGVSTEYVFNTDVDARITAASLAPINSPTFTGVPVLPTYTLGTLPGQSAGGIIYVSDANASVGAIAFSNGTNWIDPGTGVTVA